MRLLALSPRSVSSDFAEQPVRSSRKPRTLFVCFVKAERLICRFLRSKPTGKQEHDDDDQDDADDTDAAMAVAVAVTAEAATKATDQKNDEDNEKDSSERHDHILLLRDHGGAPAAWSLRP